MPTAKKTTTPKAPQDRKKKAEEIVPVDPSTTPGWELLKSFDEIPVWDQTDLLALLQEVTDTGEETDEGTDFDVRIIGKLVKAIQPYALDDAEFLKFVSGAGAIQRSSTLAMAWVGQMGEFISSGN